MAIDTASKRFSMLNMASGFDGSNVTLLFEADATVDLDDRQAMLDCYNGNAFGAPTGIVPNPIAQAYYKMMGMI